MSTATRMTAAAGAVLALGLAGCGGGGEPSASETMGPIDKLFESMYGEWDPEQSNRDMLRMEEIIAECMAEQGFDYTPVDYNQGDMGPMPVDDDGIEEEWGTLEFAKKWGYGATTNPWGEPSEEPIDDPGQVWVDPNQEYVEAMSESEQQAYYTALYGEQWNMEWTEEMESGEYVWDWTTAGCSGRAQHEVYGDGWGATDNEFADLEAEMQLMWEAMSSDPRLAEVAGKWATCMAEAGYPGLNEIYDAENSIYERVNAVWENAYQDMPPDASEDDWRAVEASVQSDLAAITPDEIKTATDDYTCRDRVRYNQTQVEVNIEHQQRFYDLHKEELEAWAESMSSRSAG